MNDEQAAAQDRVDVGEYCREVEAHLARVNAGEIIRITGAGFELVRGWALEGIPLSVACHGISMKAERHRAGRATRPLRIEFCAADVREVYLQWRRAVGLPAAAVLEGRDGETEESASSTAPADAARRPSLARHLQRAIDRMSVAVGRTDLALPVRDALERVFEELARLADGARGARGPARDALVAALQALDREMLAGVRAALPAADLDRLAAQTARDLAGYRGRVAPEVWHRSVELGVDRRLREDLGLPTLEV